MLQRIHDANNELVALIIRANYRTEMDSIKFFTPPHFSQQLAYMSRPKGMKIDPHIHKKVNREVQITQEVLVVKSGRVRADLYTCEQKYLESVVLESGDVILLVSGGHGFTMLEPTEMIEVKQGPFMGDQDKVRFQPVDHHEPRVQQ